MIVISRYLLNAYLCGIPVSFLYSSYDDAKSASFRYQNNMLDDYEKKRFNTEESYMKHKMFTEFPPNMFLAPIWPVTLPMLFIPRIVKMGNQSSNKN